MLRALSKVAIRWYVERNGADVEETIQRDLERKRDPLRRWFLEESLGVVRAARKNPARFANEVERAYDLVTEGPSKRRRTRRG